MPQPKPQFLSAEQLPAINLILVGKTFTDIAEMLGKDRHTVYRWRQNPHFISALNDHRKEIYEAGQMRLHGLLNKAITVMDQKLDEGNIKVAFEVLRLVNVTPKTIKADYEDDPEKIAAREAERLASEALSATPFGRENMGIGAHRKQEMEALANDIYEVIKEKYKISTELEELTE
jgi:hypothetical protein